MRIFCVLFVIVFVGCGSAIRDGKVYGEELDFFDAVFEEQTRTGKAIIGESCKCSEVSGVYGFETKACQELADTVLVIESRMRYHTDFMRYLGGLSDDRPNELLNVPEASTLCPDGGF